MSATVPHLSGSAEFSEKVLKSTVPVLVDFYAEWCGPCQMIAPVMDKLSQEYAGKASIVKIDVDDPANAEIVQKHGVMSIPTTVVYKNGAELKDSKKIGAMSEDGYRALLAMG